jgi:hypothetical protein
MMMKVFLGKITVGVGKGRPLITNVQMVTSPACSSYVHFRSMIPKNIPFLNTVLVLGHHGTASDASIECCENLSWVMANDLKRTHL